MADKIFETGTNSSNVNNLILHCDNTESLNKRMNLDFGDFYYRHYKGIEKVYGKNIPKSIKFALHNKLSSDLTNLAYRVYDSYNRENTDYTISIVISEIKEFCSLIAERFTDWLNENITL